MTKTGGLKLIRASDSGISLPTHASSGYRTYRHHPVEKMGAPLPPNPTLPHYGATVGEVQEELELERTEAAQVLAEAREIAEGQGVALDS
jgi:hypothetical protein